MEAISRDVARHLVQRGLLGREALVDGGVSMCASRRRNRFVVVKQRFGPSFFVKQGLHSEAMSEATVAREAGVYRLAADGGTLTPLRGLMPHFHDYDEPSGILVTELVEDAHSLAELHNALGHCPVELAARVGAGIAAYHDIAIAPEIVEGGLFPRAVPWVLKLDTDPDISFLRRSGASNGLLDLILAAPSLVSGLSALREGWRSETLIHTDTRWDNFLLAPKHRPLEERRLYIVDWELADLGDPTWDIATVFHAYLSFWIDTIPLDGEASGDELAAGAKRPLEAVQPAIAAFWQEYTSALRAPPPPEFLDRCLAMMAARMIVTTMEISGHVEDIPGRAMLLLQIATNVLERPSAAAADLLGIEARASGAADPDGASPSGEAGGEPAVGDASPSKDAAGAQETTPSEAGPSPRAADTTLVTEPVPADAGQENGRRVRKPRKSRR